MQTRKNIYTVAYVFQIISMLFNTRTIFVFLSIYYGYYIVDWLLMILPFLVYIIPLAWMIPMTLRTKKAIAESEAKNHIALGICTLLFQSLIAGILILVATNSKTEPVFKGEISDKNLNDRNDLDYI